MNVLLLSTGGGGGNILRSVKTLFARDVAVTRKTDAAYAERLQNAVTTRFLDTNEFSLVDIPAEERIVIGSRTTGGLGARHDPDVARQAFEESRSGVEDLIARHSVIVLIGTGGKGTGAGTIFPLAQIARQQRKIVIPLFVRPSFERHEVDKRRYDHAVKVVEQFDEARIRFIEVLNDRGYVESDPQPQSIVWERMNLPLARALRGLLYVLWDLSQVDPSDLSALFAGRGRLRLGFAEIDPADGRDPAAAQIEEAVHECWENRYYVFSRPAGTSLICIQGHWSNLVDARIKGQLAAAAMRGADDSPYNPLYARAFDSPRPWGVTALFGEYSGAHQPLDIDWGGERQALHVKARVESMVAALYTSSLEPAATDSHASSGAAPDDVSSSSGNANASPDDAGAASADANVSLDDANAPVHDVREPDQNDAPPFASLWEFAVAVNRSNPAALALAGNGANCGIPIDGLEVRKLLGTMWFRTVVPRVSREWQTRMLDALVGSMTIENHAVRLGRQTRSLSELTNSQLQEVVATTALPDAVRSDVDLLLIVARLWGGDAVGRVRFSAGSPRHEGSAFASVLQRLRS